MQNMYSVCLSNGYVVLLVLYNTRQNENKDMGSNHHAADLNLLSDTCNHEGVVTVQLQQNCNLRPEKHTPRESKSKSNKYRRFPVIYYTATVILNSVQNFWYCRTETIN